MIIKTRKAIPESEITDPKIFSQRRSIIKTFLASMAVGSDIMPAFADTELSFKNLSKGSQDPAGLAITPAELVKHYTNYYEFTIDKESSADLAQALTISPWSVEIMGEVEQPQTLGLSAVIWAVCFFYATLHVLGYLIVDQDLVWSIIYTDMIESPYIWFGVLTYVIIFLLAVTSPNAVKKIMGRSWKKLHRSIYCGSIAALIHYFWQLKGNLLEPVFYAVCVFILLAFRVLVRIKERQLNRLMIPISRFMDD